MVLFVYMFIDCVDVNRLFSVFDPSKIFMFHIKRFGYSQFSMYRKKERRPSILLGYTLELLGSAGADIEPVDEDNYQNYDDNHNRGHGVD